MRAATLSGTAFRAAFQFAKYSGTAFLMPFQFATCPGTPFLITLQLATFLKTGVFKNVATDTIPAPGPADCEIFDTEVKIFSGANSCAFQKSSYLCTRNTELAQLVEHWSPKPGVGSSSLSFRADETSPQSGEVFCAVFLKINGLAYFPTQELIFFVLNKIMLQKTLYNFAIV